jgi:toxin ParE1/3/4
MTLKFSRGAEDEAASAVAWYNNQRDDLGFEFLDALQAFLEMIESGPRRYPRVDHINPGREVRHAIMRRFPDRVVFEIKSDQSLLVLAVAHTRRHPDYWQQRSNE